MPDPEMYSLMKPCEVARLIRVDPKTVSRWIAQGKLAAVRTPGGHYRVPREEFYKMMEDVNEQD